MRAGLSTIQQTLSPEAAAVVNNSISEAARRRHAQTTPLHVASALLSSPSSRLREACVRSHPSDPSLPLQGSCRALELCFNVALDRLSSSPSASPPPVSNALMAALKRAQASQRRGCPEQLQQPLLAVRVELEQLLLSILDDPSVSRVMREASFSSVSVKAALEQSPVATSLTPPPQANRTLHTSVPRLHHQPSVARPTNEEEAEKVVEVFSRTKKRNPILVGESGLDSVLEEVLGRVRRNEAGEELRNARVVNLAEETQLGNLIETHLGSQTYVVVNLGNLMSLLEGDEDAAVKVAEIGRALGSGGERVRLIGTANCATYLRLQNKHPTVETDWDLRALPVTVEVQPYPRGNSNGILHASSKGIASQKRNESTCKAPPPPLLGKEMCPSCADGEELVDVSKPGANLPSWLRSAVPPDGTDVPQTLLKKWKDKCHELHPRVEQPHASLHGPPVSARPDHALGRLKPPPVRSSLDLFNRKGDNGMIADIEGYKSLLKGLTEAVSWQPEAASDVALAVTRCRSGRGGWKSRDDTWLLFMGPDKVGKRRMASTLSDHFCSRMASVELGSGEVVSRGKTAVDRLAEELRRNPFAVFLLEDVDTADARMQGSLRRAAETGRLMDSRGGEVHLSAAIIVLTSSSLPESLRSPAAERAFRCEAKLEAAAGQVCRFEVVVGNKRLADERFQCGKRRKEEKPNVSLDLNLAVGLPEDVDDEGLTSSDLTWESAKEEQQGKFAVLEVPVAAELPPEWIFNCVDQAVAFRGVDLGALREKMADGLSSRYQELGGGRRLEVEEEVLDCAVGSVWFGFGSQVEQRLEEALAAGVGVGREGSVARLVVARRGLPADVTAEERKGWSSGRLEM